MRLGCFVTKTDLCSQSCSIWTQARLRGNLTFPDNEDSPSECCQFPCNFSVTLHISLKLLVPKLNIGFRRGRHFATRMTMPETAMDEYDRAVPRQNYVWASRQSAAAKTVAQTHVVQRAAERNLGFGVFRSDAPHSGRALGRVQRIGHCFNCPSGLVTDMSLQPVLLDFGQPEARSCPVPGHDREVGIIHEIGQLVFRLRSNLG